MREDFLHYLWQFKKFAFAKAKTTHHQAIEILKVGHHNLLAGPDFFDARIRIDETIWVGNVEIHSKASDWYRHNHETDPAYDNVILHVVWESDVEVYTQNNTPLPTLVLKEYVDPDLLSNYKKLFARHANGFINCEVDFNTVPTYTFDNWVERVYLERLERKVTEIEILLQNSANDWEAVLFKMLARNLGTRINGAAFTEMADQIPYTVIRKLANEKGSLEALFFGICNLIPQENPDMYATKLMNQYKFLQAKFNITQGINQQVQFFKLRPVNFPTLRLSQLASLYEGKKNSFAQVIALERKAEFYTFFEVAASTYWDTHYNFGKSHNKRIKKLSKSFIDLVLINTIIPLKFAYARAHNEDIDQKLIALIQSIKAEKNTVVERFKTLRPIKNTALHSQSMLQLYSAYCTQNKCLQCAVGNYLISQSATGK